MQLPLDSIRRDGGTQPRDSIIEEAVMQYAEAMADGATFPPVTVFYDGESYWLADGFHRWAAHVQAGLEEIAVDVRQGTVRDAILHSVGANADHGFRRTNEDKRRAVLKLLEDSQWRQNSDNWIAQTCRVDHKTVTRIRDDLGIPKSDIRTGRDGRTINTANIGGWDNRDPEMPPFLDRNAPAVWECDICGHRNGTDRAECANCHNGEAVFDKGQFADVESKLPTRQEALKRSQETGMAVLGRDGKYHADVPQDRRDRLDLWFAVKNAVWAMSELNADATAIINSVPPYQRAEFRERLTRAVTVIDAVQTQWEKEYGASFAAE